MLLSALSFSHNLDPLLPLARVRFEQTKVM
jgi:hypothetical protein